MVVSELFSSKLCEASIGEKFPIDGVESFVWEDPRTGVITLSSIKVSKDQRNSGAGTMFMTQLCRYADQTKQKIVLTPSTDYGASSVSRLKEFYKRFGFVENKGKNKDFTVSETMYREPK